MKPTTKETEMKKAKQELAGEDNPAAARIKAAILSNDDQQQAGGQQMQMTDEQVWTDLERFAAAMKRAATVVMNGGAVRAHEAGKRMDFNFIRERFGIKEIIEPPAKKTRPLNAEEWKRVAGCLLITPQYIDGGRYVFESFDEVRAAKLADFMATCHPPGFPNDIRKLWVEE